MCHPREDDETNVDLFRSLRDDILSQQEIEKRKEGDARMVEDGMVRLEGLIAWLEKRMGQGLGSDELGVSGDVVMDEAHF